MKQVFNNIQKSLLAIAVLFVMSGPLYAKGKKMEQNDRQYWCSLLYKMVSPVLENMSKGQLRQNMLLEVSPRWDGRTIEVAYMECFGRVMAGAAPWLSLPDDNSEEGKMRQQVKTWALASYKNAVDPGYNGSQPGISDVYTNGGSLYMTTLAFLPLGLSADDSFWTSAPEKWTSKKAWDGDEFPKDHAINE